MMIETGRIDKAFPGWGEQWVYFGFSKSLIIDIETLTLLYRVF
jgi:hypothetical protein